MKGTAAWAVAEIVNESKSEMIDYFNRLKKQQQPETRIISKIEGRYRVSEELDKAIVVLQEKYRRGSKWR